MPERTFTTHEIAKICDVYPSSVNHWINDGKLKAYATPGRHHRVTREDLIGFLRTFRIPIPPDLLDETLRVLIVEDDLVLAKVLKKAFLQHPRRFAVEVCHNGVEALIHIGGRKPDLVVLDIVLPKMDGLQVCEIMKAKAETRGIKIIVVTGKKLAEPAKQSLKKKVDGLFTKPVDIKELVEHAAKIVQVYEGVKS